MSQRSANVLNRLDLLFGKVVARLLLEGSIVFTIVYISLLYQLYTRGILTTGGILNTELIGLVTSRSIFIAISYVLVSRSLLYFLSLSKELIYKPHNNELNKQHPVLSSLNNIYISLVLILTTVHIRPILQKVHVADGASEISQAFVRLDAHHTVFILFIPALLLIFFIWKKKFGFARYLHIALVITLIVVSAYINNKVNYPARIYESRANWITEDWLEQGIDAQKALEDAETDEEKAVAYYWLGVSKNRQKDHAAAVDYQMKAIDLQPDYGAAHASLANGYLFLGEYDKALYHGEKCEEYWPDYAWCYQALSNYYGVTGDIDTAIELIQKAIDLDPYQDDFKEQLQSLINYKNSIQQ